MPDRRLTTMLGGYVLLSTSGVLLLRRALDVTRSSSEALSGTVLSPGALVGGLAYAASFAVWLFALRWYPATTIYPLFVGAGVLGVALAGWIILGEALSPIRAVGIAAVLVGILLLTR